MQQFPPPPSRRCLIPCKPRYLLQHYLLSNMTTLFKIDKKKKSFTKLIIQNMNFTLFLPFFFFLNVRFYNILNSNNNNLKTFNIHFTKEKKKDKVCFRSFCFKLFFLRWKYKYKSFESIRLWMTNISTSIF